MPRITPQHWRVLACIFMAAGFVLCRQESSHKAYEKEGVLRPLIIPEYASVGIDIIQNLLRTAGMSRAEYFRLLEGC